MIVGSRETGTGNAWREGTRPERRPWQWRCNAVEVRRLTGEVAPERAALADVAAGAGAEGARRTGLTLTASWPSCSSSRRSFFPINREVPERRSERNLVYISLSNYLYYSWWCSLHVRGVLLAPVMCSFFSWAG